MQVITEAPHETSLPRALPAAGLSGTAPALALIVLGAASARLFLMRLIPLIETDGAFYARLAEEMVRGTGQRGFHPAWPPFYPAMIAVLARILLLFAGAHPELPAIVESAGRLVNILLGSFLPIPVYFLGRRLGGSRAGLAAAALAAFHPRLLVFSVQVLTEMPFTFFSTLFLLLFGTLLEPPDGGRSRTWKAGLAGLAAAAACLTRPEGLLLPLLGAGFLLAGSRRSKGRIVSAGLLLVVFGLAAAPRVFEVSRSVGHFSFGTKSDYNLAQAYAGVPGVPRFDRTRSVYNNFVRPGAPFQPEPIPRFSLVSLVLGHPGAVLRHAAVELPHAVAALPSLASIPFVLAALAALFWKRRRSRDEVLWLFFWLGLVGLYTLVFVYRRFFAAAIPPLLVEAGLGLALLSRRHTGLLYALLLAAAAWGFLAARSSLAREPYAIEERELVAALKMKTSARADADPAVMARKPFAAYYAGSSILAMADGPPEELAAAAQSRGARFLVIDERTLVREKPRFAGFLEPDSTAADRVLALVARAGSPPHRAVLYEVLPGTNR